MRTALLVSLAVVVGCKARDPYYCREHPDKCNDGGEPIDMPIDSPDAPPKLYGGGDYEIRVGASGDLSYANMTLMTSGGNPCSSAQFWVNTNQPAACFVVAGSITITNVTFAGTRPLVIVADDTITVTGLLDVSSHNAAGVQTAGAGVGNPPTGGCEGTLPAASSGGAGGGAGGSFKTKGGNGGAGNGVSAGAAANPVASTEPTLLRTGCSGQTGGEGNGTGTGGSGGGGGGAVYLVAGNAIDLTGATINASGAGGSAGSTRGGGGGGGAGGMIVLFANSIMTGNQTKLVANGGGGGGGANGGGHGSDPDPSMPTVEAPGGGAGACGTNAGGLGAVNTNPGDPGGAGCGGGGGGAGGGGGGGVGYIQSNKALSGSFSPNPSIL